MRKTGQYRVQLATWTETSRVNLVSPIPLQEGRAGDIKSFLLTVGSRFCLPVVAATPPIPASSFEAVSFP